MIAFLFIAIILLAYKVQIPLCSLAFEADNFSTIFIFSSSEPQCFYVKGQVKHLNVDLYFPEKCNNDIHTAQQIV